METSALPARAVEPANATAQNVRTTKAYRFIAGKEYTAVASPLAGRRATGNGSGTGAA
jgi:hypothetical protein